MMKKILLRLFFPFAIAFISISPCSGQIILEGKLIDAEDGESIPYGIIIIAGTDNGTSPDLDGEFILKSAQPLPWLIEISVLGYDPLRVEVHDVSKVLPFRLTSSAIRLNEAEVYERGLSKAQNESARTSYTLDNNMLQQSASHSVYGAASVAPEVDSPSPSFGFRVINTRGFTSASPVRSLQLIDGIDNQAPGLNFSLGNFLGASDLDVLSLEIIAGAAGAYYGPAAFNGVIHIKTKNPFIHTGLSGYVKAGERNYQEAAVRYADVFKNKQGHDFLAYKLNAFALRADDWRAENYTPVTDSRDTIGNPGRFDAVNIYGDEYFLRNDYRDTSHFHNDLCRYKGLRTFYRTGYKEVDLVDYNTENYKAGIAIHLRTKPSKGIESPSIILSGNYGAGTTVYQGDNRFSLKGIQFAQSKIEFSKPDKFFLRAYHTLTDAGKSYDPYFTALRLQELSKDESAWSKAYTDFWDDYGRIKDSLQLYGYPDNGCVYPDSTLKWLEEHTADLQRWHGMAAHFADSVNIREPASYNEFYMPGTSRFDSVFAMITNRPNTSAGGTQFYDHSSLFQIAGEYTLEVVRLGEFRAGGNYRKYLPVSRGTIFSDTSGTRIRNSEVGIYAGWKKKFLDQKLIANLVVRGDKNQNLDWNITPAASLVYHVKDRTYFRFSYSSAIRNPTLSDQYLHLNVGPAILAGHIGQIDSLITIPSFTEWRNTNDITKLTYFNIDEIRPEKVTTFEVGIRSGLFKNTFYVDANYYRNSYRDFLGYLVGLDVMIIPGPYPDWKNLEVYRYSANSINRVTTHGASIGINFYPTSKITCSGNYSFNQLTKSVEDDPIIPAYNTPAHKVNLGLTIRGIEISKSPFLRNTGFAIQYKWVNGYRFEGSPQFTGYIPTYATVDAQVNVRWDKTNTSLKIGATNVLNHQHTQVYGGPAIGRLAYIQIGYRF